MIRPFGFQRFDDLLGLPALRFGQRKLWPTRAAIGRLPARP